jgi:YD repeat-containing protein
VCSWEPAGFAGQCGFAIIDGRQWCCDSALEEGEFRNGVSVMRIWNPFHVFYRSREMAVMPRLRKTSILIGGALILGLPLASAANAAETIQYQYDAQGRLIATTRTGTINNGASVSYTIDPADNRTNRSVTGARLNALILHTGTGTYFAIPITPH